VSTEGQRTGVAEEIYENPADYDLEVAAHKVRDLPFWTELVRRERPRRVLEVGCGTGRLTLPLARLGAAAGFTMVGLEPAAPMLRQAARRAADAAAETRAALQLIEGDIRDCAFAEPFEIILMPYGAAHHLTTIEDQLAAWRNARHLLAPEGLFVVDLSAPNLAQLAAACGRTTPRAEDLVAEGDAGQRLRRTVAVSYDAVDQEALLDYRYVVRDADGGERRYESPFAMHVYYPRELALLFMSTGFTLERLLGSYEGEPFGNASPQLIALGRATEQSREQVPQKP